MKNPSSIIHHQLSIASLPPIREMMVAAGLAPKKHLGQNFLFDLNLTGKIARSVPDIEHTTVVEVGPGPGGLTRALLMAGAARVIAIEKDKATEPILSQIAAAADGRLDVIYGDALKWMTDDGQWIMEDYAVCSNLPYNIGTELLIHWLHIMATSSIINHPSSLTLMFQREVAERIVAHVGDGQYGRLAVLTSLVADAKILFNVPAAAFFPAPKVQSAVVQIIPNARKIASLQGLDKIEKLTAKLFGQRRKMIRGIIRNVDWSQFGLTGTERAEELLPEKFAEMAEALITSSE
ncbi:MAG: 16S rRNA (adenine(1518)-N(6)/adenine(1519)-N(6))-dimethyltransferase RsmA [Rickettsiales bacterium]|jgi:16S rRNA (adenine1518-N6/adenine1519-N6)-dimethyltransferase|nr:16S rRNA (adenine(1518)-N(6)/adenine(1519)-N(6))-dimethyltransferase RsmA [Rickettsiales bacterium]